MLSIITAIHNQKAVNKIYWEFLMKNTFNSFELIVINNNSNDGSADFFNSIGATVIENKENYSYPYSQNQGIAIAQHDWLAFLNNDIIVSPHWDKKIIESMENNSLDVATVCGIEQIENSKETKKLRRRWNRIKSLLSLFGHNTITLKLMFRWMYPDWEKFNSDRNFRFSGHVKEGFVGNSVIMRRRAFEKIGLWDERIQSADFDLYLRTKKRADDFGDIKPVNICLDVFNHHYIRLTAKGGYPPFADSKNLISLEEKWNATDLAMLKNLNK